MKLYDGGKAPNPRRVRIFLAEKGIKVDVVPVDIGHQEHKTDAYSAINPLQRVPSLVLDDGTVITESIAICRYFEGMQPEPNLFGAPGLEAAKVEMWNRRVELHLLMPVAQVFRHLHPAMKTLEVPQVAEWGEANKPHVANFLKLLDGELEKRAFVAGDRYTVADITALMAVDLMKPAKLVVPDELGHVKRWHAGMAARPSSAA
ncbi:MAG: glutathione S-transferase [Nitrobacter sp.]